MNSKIIFIGIGLLSLAGTFAVGRFSAPKPTTQIQYVDKIKYVKDEKITSKTDAKKEEKKDDKKIKHSKGHVVVVQHKTKNKDGQIDTITTRTIDFDNHTKTDKADDLQIAKKSNTTTNTHIQQDETKNEEIKQTYPSSGSGIDYTFMVGRSLNNPRMDFMGQIGVPLFWGLFKANAGYEWNDKKIFVGATLNF